MARHRLTPSPVGLEGGCPAEGDSPSSHASSYTTMASSLGEYQHSKTVEAARQARAAAAPSVARGSALKAAWSTLDPEGLGHIPPTELVHRFKASAHPWVKLGHTTTEEVQAAFLRDCEVRARVCAEAAERVHRHHKTIAMMNHGAARESQRPQHHTHPRLLNRSAERSMDA